MARDIRVSVYITTQNRPALLERALKSLENQTVSDFEVLICNDASTPIHDDDYLRIKNKYQDKFINLEYVVNESKRGACFSRNRLIDLSKGDYITGLDDDDAFHPRRLEEFLNFESVLPGKYSFVCSGVDSLEGGGGITKLGEGTVISFTEMKKYNPVGNQIFVRSEIIKGVGGFDVNMPAWQDYDTWFRIIKKYGSAYKLNSQTMLLDSSDSRERISTGSKAYQGYKKFVEKHFSDLSDKDLNSLKYTDMINRKVKFSILEKELFADKELFFRVLKYKSVYDYPFLFKVYKRLIQKR